MNKALQYAIYKGTGGKHGAIQLNFQKPHYYKDRLKDFEGNQAFSNNGGKWELNPGWKAREGAIFMEIASTKDKNEYDWDNKIVLALSIDDMGKVLETLLTGNECKLMHDPGAKSETAGVVKKYLHFYSPKGIKEGCMISASMNAGGDTKTHTVPVSSSEVLVLRALFQAAISKSLNW
jgi:hypothetical protein